MALKERKLKMGKPKSKQPSRIPLKQMQTRAAEKLKQQSGRDAEKQSDASNYATERVEQAGASMVRDTYSGARTVGRKAKNEVRSRARNGKRPATSTGAGAGHSRTDANPTGRSPHGETMGSGSIMPSRQISTARSGKTVGQRDRAQPIITARRNAMPQPPSGEVRRPASRTATEGRSAQRAAATKTRGETVLRTRENSSIRRSARSFKTKQTTGRFKATAKKVQQTARRRVTKRAAEMAKRAAKATARIAARVAQAAVRAAVSLVGALIGLIGGSGFLILVLLVALIAAVVSSPFGLFFASDSSEPEVETVAVCEAVTQINAECGDEIERLQEGSYDTVELDGQIPDWADVLAVFSSKYAAADDGVDVATLDADRVDKLSNVFWDMTTIASEKESVYHEDTDPEDGVDDSYTEVVLRITVTTKAADEMAMEYGFTDYQVSAMTDMLAEREGLLALAGSLEITDEDVLDVLNALPDDLPADRRAVAETALRLVGKVGYFWGGKSTAIGWDSRWGQLAKVTADGSSTTGTYRPFGLDCTGFLDWTLRNAGLHSDGQWHIGTNLTAVSEADAQVGDFMLNADNSHIGVVVGRTDDGELLICHCTAGNGVVVTEFGAGGFAKVGRLGVCMADE